MPSYLVERDHILPTERGDARVIVARFQTDAGTVSHPERVEFAAAATAADVAAELARRAADWQREVARRNPGGEVPLGKWTPA